jgi:GH43 family beta-xylosidase
MEYWKIGKMEAFGKWVFCWLLILFVQSGVNGQGKKREEIRIRDPFVLADQGTGSYYLYASISNRADKDLGVEVYKSRDLEKWEGPFPVFRVAGDFWGNRMVWAPEVHQYNGKYYLFVTFTSEKKLTQVEGRPEILNRASQVLVSDTPEGPFTPFANKPHTPEKWMSLDATLWVENGKPWMIFCHEWVQITDGTIELVRLKKDLSAAIGNPVTLFRATDAVWVKSLGETGTSYQNKLRHGYVTDGPFLYRTKSGKLLMIWSSFGEKKYAVGLAESMSGKVKGPWKVIQKPLYRANGGHGMIFRTFDGRLLLALHQPNNSPNERAHFFELEDTGDTIRLKNQ